MKTAHEIPTTGLDVRRITARIQPAHHGRGEPPTARKLLKGWLVCTMISLLVVLGCGMEEPAVPYATPEGDNAQETSVQRPTLQESVNSVRDLFDMERLQSLSLADLRWKETGRTVNRAGVTVILGEWSSGLFTGLNSEGVPQTIEMKHKAEIYLPAGFPRVSLPGAGKGLVMSRNQARFVKGDSGNIFSPAFALERAARDMGVATLGHGEVESNWTSLGFEDRNALFIQTLRAARTLNPCVMVDWHTGNHLLELARSNIMAITLLARLAEAEGGVLTEFALRGASKEGLATWMVSAVDDRLTVAAPGSYQLQDLAAFDRYEDQMGCGGDILGLMTVKEILGFRNWLEETPAGQAYARFLLPVNFKHLIHPAFLFLSGDAGMWGMHDGMFFRLGAETPFLEGLKEREWRYDRYAGVLHSGWLWAWENRMLTLLAGRLALGSDGFDWPRVKQAAAEDNGTEITVTAQAEGAFTAHLFWNQSAARSWGERGQSGWKKVAMRKHGGVHVADIMPDPGNEVAWYVEATRNVTIGSATVLVRDASLIRFERELPPETCRDFPEPSCGN